MKLEKEYKYSEKAFQKDCFDYENGINFSDLINSFQIEFVEEFSSFPANYLYMNFEGMQLIKKCFTSEDDDLSNEIFGQDFIIDDMEKNFEINHSMDQASSKILVYAISTEFDLDEPLYLIKDTSIAKDTLLLKYISDSGDDEIEEPIPVDELLLVNY